jgi:hypothetical protein
MANKEKTIKRELIRLRKTQNPEQFDFRKMRKIRAAKASLLKLKRKGTVAPVKEVAAEKKKVKPKKKTKKKDAELEVIKDDPEIELFEDEPELEVEEEEPELEVVEEEPELEIEEEEPELEVVEEEPKEISEELEELYSYDDDIAEEDAEEDSE